MQYIKPRISKGRHLHEIFNISRVGGGLLNFFREFKEHFREALTELLSDYKIF